MVQSRLDPGIACLQVKGVGPNLSFADLGSPNGLGLSAQTDRCTKLGTFDTAQCFGAQAFCEGAYVIERRVPRARELADVLQVVIPGFSRRHLTDGD